MQRLSKEEIEKAVNWCEMRASEHPIGSNNKIMYDKEVMDFYHENHLADQFRNLQILASKHLGKNFIARVRIDPDGEFIFYELLNFESCEVFDKSKTNRGTEPIGEFEIYCFSIMADVKTEYGVKAGSYSLPEKTVIEKKQVMFFAPPLKKYILM